MQVAAAATAATTTATPLPGVSTCPAMVKRRGRAGPRQTGGPADEKADGYRVLRFKSTMFGSAQADRTRVIVDRVAYDYVGRLGSGSYGSVYKVCDTVLPQLQFALKVFNEGTVPISVAVANENLVAYHREAYLLSKVLPPHPSMVTVLGYDRSSRNSSAAIVMELLDGDLSRCRCVTYQSVVHLMYQLLTGLQHMHHYGVVHADIKPANILVSSDFTKVKLADLSISFRLHPTEVYITTPMDKRSEPDLGVGTVWYRAPEVAAYGMPDRLPRMANAAVDVWALGCVIWELFTGKPMFPVVAKNASEPESVENQRMLSMHYQEFGAPPAVAQSFPSAHANGDRLLTAMLHDAVRGLIARAYPDAPKKSQSTLDAFMLMWNGLMEMQCDRRWTAKHALESPVFDEYQAAISGSKGLDQKEMWNCYVDADAKMQSMDTTADPPTPPKTSQPQPPPQQKSMSTLPLPPLHAAPKNASEMPPQLYMLPLIIPPPQAAPLPPPVKLVVPPKPTPLGCMKPPLPRPAIAKKPLSGNNSSASHNDIVKDVQFFPFRPTNNRLPIKL